MPGLASIAAEVRLRKGAKLFAETDAPTLHSLVTGEISLESPGEGSTILAGPNDAIGIQHTLGGIPLGCSAHVLQDGTALRIDREDLFDLIAQRPDLMRQLFAAMCRKARAGMQVMGK
jgi:CRP-like cAMP-binding protein